MIVTQSPLDFRRPLCWPSFGLRTLFELTFVCGVIFYVWFQRQPSNAIQPDHVLQLDATGTLIDAPVQGVYLVDPDGYVNLGAVYGKVNVLGLSGDEAEAAIRAHLQRFLPEPSVTASIVGWKHSWELERIHQLEAEVEQLRQEQRSAERKRKGYSDPQGPARAGSIPMR